MVSATTARPRAKGAAAGPKFDYGRVGVTGGEMDSHRRDYDDSSGRYDMVVARGADYPGIDRMRRRKAQTNPHREGG